MNAHARNVQTTIDDAGIYSHRTTTSATEGRVVIVGNTYYGKIVSSVGDYQTVAAQTQPLGARFKLLAERWKRETLNMSAMEDIVLHPAYQEIIGMGPAVIQFIIDELEIAPNHWFAALSALSGGENPVAEHDYGDFDRMVEAWIDWAKKHGYR